LSSCPWKIVSSCGVTVTSYSGTRNSAIVNVTEAWSARISASPIGASSASSSSPLKVPKSVTGTSPSNSFWPVYMASMVTYTERMFGSR